MSKTANAHRSTWSHRDLLRLSHPKATGVRNEILKFASRKDGKLDVETGHPFIDAYQAVQRLNSSQVDVAVSLIRDANLPREALPTEFLNDVRIWEALLERMPLTAMIRNLGKMTSIGLLAPLSDGTKKVVAALSNGEALRKARVHPMTILTAMKIYQAGRGAKGSLSWNTVGKIVDSLDSAFYASFANVEPTGKNHFLAVDCSGSMSSNVSGSEFLSCRDAAAAMALVIANSEPWCEIVGFSSGTGRAGGWGRGSGIGSLNITPSMRLDRVAQIMNGFAWGSTDCSLPMQYARDQNLPVDVFVTITDNDTNTGSIHPSQALKQYRDKSGRPAHSIVMGMTASQFTIADPKDSRSLDVVGFDAGVMPVINSFVRG